MASPLHDRDLHDDSDNDESGLPKRLVLCFDGTGDDFKGNTNDTNIVKLYEMFDRSAPRQMRYYQPGIGTYTMNSSVNTSFFGQIKRNVSEIIDEAFGTTFDAHVIAGYRFLMRYYSEGDPVFIFGFSRGAFTARFLARMLANMGLLSRGNEVMVPFAYKVFQDYEMSVKNAEPYMETFRSTFCRHSREPVETGVKVHFLGLFDTVNSISTFDVPFTRTIKVPEVLSTARHVRHAVAVDERRVKFKAALCSQDQSENTTDDIKEVWFPGNHGDIGGGWPAESEGSLKTLSWWQRLRYALFGSRASNEAHSDKSGDVFQLSDIALKWMIDELDELSTNRILWNEAKKQDFLDRFNRHRSEAIKARVHDTLSIGGGEPFVTTLIWNLLEYLPFFRRWEYIADIGWQYVLFPLNKGAYRDIPPSALFHHSIVERLSSNYSSLRYRPRNQINFGMQIWPLFDVETSEVRDGLSSSKAKPYLVPCGYPDGGKETDRIYEIGLN